MSELTEYIGPEEKWKAKRKKTLKIEIKKMKMIQRRTITNIKDRQVRLNTVNGNL